MILVLVDDLLFRSKIREIARRVGAEVVFARLPADVPEAARAKPSLAVVDLHADKLDPPGSLEFIKYATAKGVAVFYVSNRKGPEEDATRNNLAKLGYPVDDKEDTVLMRDEKPEWTSEKGTRRAAIAERS